MKNTILGFLIVLLTACNSYNDYYMEQDLYPVITMYKNNIALAESIDSVKANTTLSYNYKIAHRENLKISTESEINDLITITSDSIILKNLNSVSDGLYSINCFAQDIYNKKTEKQIQVYIFNNLAPVALFSHKIDKTNSRIIEIDASKSFDKDARWGGEIKGYEYHFDNAVRFETNYQIVKFVFNGPGEKEVKVRVIDNDGLWSDYNTQIITIF